MWEEKLKKFGWTGINIRGSRIMGAGPRALFPAGDPTCSDCEELSCPGNLLGFTLLTSGYFGTHPSKPPGTRWEDPKSKGRSPFLSPDPLPKDLSPVGPCPKILWYHFLEGKDAGKGVGGWLKAH